MRGKKIISLLTGCVMVTLAFAGNLAFGNDDYPVRTETTDGNGITMTNSVSWADSTHANDNYSANLDITINGLTDKKTFNEPVDIQIIQDISTSMDEMCYRDNHVTFQYAEEIKTALNATQLADARVEIEAYIREKLNGKPATGKNDWISFAGKTDKDGNTFSSNAWLVPKASFYLSTSWEDFSRMDVFPTDFERRYYIVDNPVPSNDDRLVPGTAYWSGKYHCAVDENGKYKSLSVVEDPTTEVSVAFSGFSKEIAIKSNCKSYTTTAYNLLSELGNSLFLANADNHLAINSFSDINQYAGVFTSGIGAYNGELLNAFNKTSGATNYEAGLVTGKNSLENHKDTDGRKQYLIFISDGMPNKALDESGNTVAFTDMNDLIQLSDSLKQEGVEIYTVGFCIDQYINDAHLLPMATDEAHSNFRTPGQLDQMIDIYDFMKSKIIEDTYIKSTVENTISKYYIVDKENLPSDVTLIEEEQTLPDGTTRTVQKIKYNIKTEDLDTNGINTKTIPLILKEEYRGTNEYYPTNDEDLGGDGAIYENLDATKHNISVKTPWLSVNTNEEQTYKIDTEVINGNISSSITGINEGENKEISYSPNDGYEIDYIEVDGNRVDVGTYENSYLFENVSGNHTIKVVYKAKDTTAPPVDPNEPSDKPTDSEESVKTTTDNDGNTAQTGDVEYPSFAGSFIVISAMVFLLSVYRRKTK